MDKKIWTAPKLEELKVTETLAGQVDQVPEGLPSGFTINGVDPLGQLS
jgi:hypothetical protein